MLLLLTSPSPAPQSAVGSSTLEDSLELIKVFAPSLVALIAGISIAVITNRLTRNTNRETWVRDHMYDLATELSQAHKAKEIEYVKGRHSSSQYTAYWNAIARLKILSNSPYFFRLLHDLEILLDEFDSSLQMTPEILQEINASEDDFDKLKEGDRDNLQCQYEKVQRFIKMEFFHVNNGKTIIPSWNQVKLSFNEWCNGSLANRENNKSAKNSSNRDPNSAPSSGGDG